MSELKPVSIKLPVEVKTAAKALTETNWDVPIPGQDRVCRSMHCFNTSQVFQHLVMVGLRQTLPLIEKTIEEQEDQQSHWQEVVDCFEVSPEKEVLKHTDLLDGRASRFLKEYEEASGLAVPRDDAVAYLYQSMRNASQARTAKAAIEAALAKDVRFLPLDPDPDADAEQPAEGQAA